SRLWMNLLCGTYQWAIDRIAMPPRIIPLRQRGSPDQYTFWLPLKNLFSHANWCSNFSRPGNPHSEVIARKYAIQQPHMSSSLTVAALMRFGAATVRER